MQGTIASMASLVSLGSVLVVGPSERSHSLVRRVALSRRTPFKSNPKRWHSVSVSVCKYSATTTDFVAAADQGNADALSLDSNPISANRASNDSANGQPDFVPKPPRKPVLKPSGSNDEPLLGMSSTGWDSSAICSDSDDEEERSKVIESLGEVLEKAEKLETSTSGELGSTKRDSGSVNKPATSNASTSSRNAEPLNSPTSSKAKTLKSVWRKGDSVAVRKVVKESSNSKPDKRLDREEQKSQTPASLRPPQPPLRPQPKLQSKPSVAPPTLKKPVILKDVGAAPKSQVTDESGRTKVRKQPILIDKFASKKPVVDPLIAQAVLGPTKLAKGPPPGKFKDEYRKKNVPAGGSRRRMVEDDVEIPDEESSELNVSIPGAARKGRKWSKASRKAARLRAAKEAAPVKVEILEVGEKGMLIEELAYNLAISEGEILGYLYSKGIKPDGVQTWTEI